MGAEVKAGIEHLVVLMLENRSFDHMLGYLALDSEVEGLDGLRPWMGNPLPGGGFAEVKPMGERLIHEKALDPGHGRRDVAIQLEGGNQGFVKSYSESFARNSKKHPPKDPIDFDPTLVLGYQEAKDVPVFDYIARNWGVCDRWFSSVPGPTWDNRMFALTGGIGDPVEIDLPGDAADELVEHAPIYDRPAFTRHLRDGDWRWYSHDPATLRLADSRYRPGGQEGVGNDHNFAYFDRPTLLEPHTFLEDAAKGDLRRVSWIDPNFVDFRLFGPPGSNDDHPPSRVMLGQELALRVMKAVMTSPQWESSMLLITYDEHGGFYDHVVPDSVSGGEEGETYGVRVPALVVSPFTDQRVSRTAFEHTSIAKTILQLFGNADAVQAMGARVEQANDLGEFVTRDAPRPPASDEDLEALETTIAAWKERSYRKQMLEEPTAGERVSEAVTDLQQQVIGAALKLREWGLGPGRP